MSKELSHSRDISNQRIFTDFDLDASIPDYKQNLKFVLGDSVFEESNQYRGEISEFYGNYLSLLDSIAGIIITGLNSKNVENTSLSVSEDLKQEFVPKKDFEIDYIYFNGKTITVVEVKKTIEQEDTSQRNFRQNIDQMREDQFVIQSLQKATGLTDVTVNYLTACLNDSIPEIADISFLQKHESYLADVR